MLFRKSFIIFFIILLFFMYSEDRKGDIMKVLLYFENQNMIRKSGIGRALKHQIKALQSQGIEYTLDPRESFDIAHINTVGLQSQ